MTQFRIASISLVALLAASGVVHAHGSKAEDKHMMDEMSMSDVDREQRAWGVAAHPSEATRTINIGMDDNMRFDPETISVTAGETVTFKVENHGKLLHEIVLGTDESLASHAAMMAKYPGMEHAEPYMAHVSPGDEGELTWTFNRDGVVRFGCLVPGHYEAGMRGQVEVE